MMPGPGVACERLLHVPGALLLLAVPAMLERAPASVFGYHWFRKGFCPGNVAVCKKLRHFDDPASRVCS